MKLLVLKSYIDNLIKHVEENNGSVNDLTVEFVNRDQKLEVDLVSIDTKVLVDNFEERLLKLDRSTVYEEDPMKDCLKYIGLRVSLVHQQSVNDIFQEMLETVMNNGTKEYK